MTTNAALLAWKDESWIPVAEAHLRLDDVGCLQGVVIVDRLRTCQGVAADVQQHVARFHRSCDAVNIQLPTNIALAEVIAECAARNQLAAVDDFSIVLLATPGRSSVSGPPQATLIVHPAPIAWKRLDDYYRRGQALSVSAHHNVPRECWSPAIKTRARLQYYLADQAAQAELQDVNAAGILPALDGSLTETSAANMLLVEGERLVSPPAEQILAGVSLARTMRLAQVSGLDIESTSISVERAKQADAILLCGTTGCLWTAARLDDRHFENPTQHPIFQRLSAAWIADIGLDYIAQARRLAGGR